MKKELLNFIKDKKLREYNLSDKIKKGEIICRVKIKSERSGRFTFL